MATANLLQTSVSGGTQNALSLQGDGVFFPKASTTSRLALTLTTTDKGFIVYDTTDNNIYFWNGAAWESIPGSGDAGANGSVQYNDNGIVSGATNFVWDKVNGRVGIGTATPTAGNILDIVSTTSNNFVRFTDSVNATGFLGIQPSNSTIYLHGNNNRVSLSCSTSNTTPTEQLRITNPGVFEFLDGAGGTRMTLNSTGLGLGGVPSGVNRFAVFNGATQALTLDTSGNLLVGTVTSPAGTKVGAIAKLSGVSVEGTAEINVSTTPVALAKGLGTGGLFFVTGYNTSGGNQGWWLVASNGGTAPSVIGTNNTTGLTVAFTTVAGVVYMNTVSGTIAVNSFAVTN